MNLYTKYRPKTLEEVKGNTDVVATLDRMLAKPDTCPHSFMFIGATGTGKTTIARIIAARLNCIGDDLQELNFSDFRGIDNAREVIRMTDYQAMEGDTRVWILDEFHKATNDAQNALLKILEEPPDHVYFIICSTDPQKIISTIKSRCSTFTMQALTDTQMYGMLRSVARKEGERLDDTVLEQITRDSLGLPRSAMVILEKVLNTEPERRLEVAQQAAIETTQTIELCRALMSRAKWSEVCHILNGMREQDAESIRRAVMGYAQAVLLKKDEPVAGLILEEMRDNFYDTGWPGLTCAAYIIVKNYAK